MNPTQYLFARNVATSTATLLAGCAGLAGCVLLAGCAASAADPSDPHALIDPAAIDESRLVTLTGNTHPKANAVYDVSAVDDSFPLEHMQLVLKRSPEAETAFEAQIDALHDRTSPVYHQWLTAQQIGDQYGVSRADLTAISHWLGAHGMTVESVPTSRMFLEFSGTAGQVREAFHTEIHRLEVAGKSHIANMSDPQIPAELTKVVVGVHALHDFMPHPLHIDRGPVKKDRTTGKWSMVGATPNFTFTDTSMNTWLAIAPADFATIYNLNPLFSAGITGAGQTIVVIEDTDLLNNSDVASFRSAFGLSSFSGTFSQLIATGSTTCTDPGENGAEGEAALDAEWSGAAAPDADIVLAACADTTTVFGGLIAVQNLINGTSPPPIISISYGECEAENGATANQSYVTTYQQAAAMGISVFVSSGDEGAASCDADRASASHGIAVSGFTSTPYNVSVGGTDFMDAYDNAIGGLDQSIYWNTANTATLGSALSYVPEIPWNDGCTGSLLLNVEKATQSYGATGFCNTATGKADFVTTASGSGGPSNFSTQPAWQTGVIGLPTKSGGPRYIPDVSLFAANGLWGHFYVYCLTDAAEGGVACDYADSTDTLDLAAGGTSFASPALAGIQALINQSTGSLQGNPNTVYYKLAAAEYGARGSAKCNSSGGTTAAPVAPASSCVFNDVTQGDIDVPCTGTINCFDSTGKGKTAVFGALTTSATAFASAYPAGTGWDFATGLGTVNATNLVNEW